MKVKMILSFILVFTSILCAQESHHSFYSNNNHYLRWGDYSYSNSLKGLGSLITDLQTLDPELYQSLHPKYNAMKKQQQEANIVAGIGGSVGGILMIVGLIPTTYDTDYQYLGQTGTLEKTKFNYGLLIAGVVVAAGSVAVAGQKWVKPDDILDFSNQFNQQSKGEKLQISMRPEIDFENGVSAGLSLYLGF